MRISAEDERRPEDVVGQRLEVGAEVPERRVAQQQRQAERAEDLRQHRPAHDVAHEQEIAEHADGGEDQRRDRHRGRGPAAEHRPHDEGRVHRQHDEVAMGEVDDVHHAPDQRQPGGEQGVDGADQQAADDDLEEDGGHGARRCVACGRGPRPVLGPRPMSNG